MFSSREISIAGLVGLALIAGVSHGGEGDYEQTIKPLLAQRCYACHGVLKQEANLRLDTGAAIRQGGDSGPAVMPESADASEILKRITSTELDQRMPPEGEPLTAKQVAAIKSWIVAGAVSPAGEKPEADPSEHWAFRIPVRPEIPSVTKPGDWPTGIDAGVHREAAVQSDSQDATSDDAKSRDAKGAEGQPLAVPRAAVGGNEIDAFLDRAMLDAGIRPRPQASDSVWLRRVYLDLIGLPPTSEELRDFLADGSSGRYQHVVDRLLDSPLYGERWARHWMDIWRYSDWFGRRHVPDVWNSAPQIWRWRDWIVRSLNGDKGYHQMLREMLAADEVVPESPEDGVATGYLIRNWYALNPNDWMRSTVEHTGKAFLGLTFNCAHCHDHKYDPISQEDYFRLRAYFEPIYIRQDRVPGEADPGPFQDYNYSTLRKIQRLGAVKVFDKNPEAATWLYTGGDERNRQEDRGKIAPGLPAFLGGNKLSKVEPVELPPVAWYPALDPRIQQTILSDAVAAVKAAEGALAAIPEATSDQATVGDDPVAKTQAAFDAALRASEAAGKPRILSGQQSMLLDATTGRRIINHRLKGLPPIEDGFVISFELELLSSTHFNFQLAKDLDKGLTAGFVGFEGGRILGYQPGTFTEFEVGKYADAEGERRFRVELKLEPSSDRMLLTVRSLKPGTAAVDGHNGQKEGASRADAKTDPMPNDLPQTPLLVDAVPIAMNGWNPAAHPEMGITFDARTGTKGAVDEWVLRRKAAGDDAKGKARKPVRRPRPSTRGKAKELIRFDFEPPAYADGTDVVGQGGWELSHIAQAPATSKVVRHYGDAELDRLAQAVEVARAVRDAPGLRRRAAQMELDTARAAVAATESRIRADRLRHGVEQGDADAAARDAEAATREAAVKRGAADVAAQQAAMATAQAKPADDANRGKELDAAGQGLTAARDRLAKAEAEAAAPAKGEYPPLGPSYPKTSTGRRKALADWIASDRNPLTARVAVNHIWARHFHMPLVATVYDFGRSGARPTHPELLDWLAVELVRSGWSMKHLHRLIVTSEAYRRSSRAGGPDAPQLAIDPENRMLWRMNVGRLEAEVLRDSVLMVAGKLDLTPGGQEIENGETLTSDRRSLYYSVHPEDGGKSPLGQLFDGPDPTECYRRTRSIIPQQALALTNSDWVHQASAGIVRQWDRAEADRTDANRADASLGSADSADRRFVTEMFARILTRAPSSDELSVCMETLASRPVGQTADATPSSGGESSADAVRKLRESFVRALLNHNDMITIR